MSVQISFYAVLTILFGVLGALSIISHLVVRRHVALAWLSAGLVVGTVASLAFTRGGSGTTAFLLLAVTETFALYAVSQAARLVIGKERSAPLLTGIGAALVALSIAMILSGAFSPVMQSLPFEIAGFLFVTDALVALVRNRGGWAERSIAAGLAMHAAVHLVRMPFFPSLLESGQAFPSLASPWLNLLLLATSSIYVPMVVLGIIARDLSGHIDTYRQASRRDGLTGLLTRLAFEHGATSATPRFGALMVADLDLFKALNDTYGHPAGDDALRAFARLCATSSPLAGRMGGEEFAILLPGASIVEAQRVADRIRDEYRRAATGDLEGARLTASFGIAAYHGRESFREALQKADRALYRAKRQGRDCVMFYGTAAAERSRARTA